MSPISRTNLTGIADNCRDVTRHCKHVYVVFGRGFLQFIEVG